MANQKQTKQNEAELSMPYLIARAEWDERYGSLITRAKNWRIAFLMMSVFACLQCIALIEEMHRSHVVPFVVAVDHLEHVVGAGLASETNAADPRMIRAQLQQYVEFSRSITSDRYVLKSHLETTFNWTLQPSEARGFLVDYYHSIDPFSLAATDTVEVNVENINRISPSSYEVSWGETKRDNLGEVVSREEWKGVFGLTVMAPKNETAAAANPLGIYITSISWSKSI